MSSPRKTDKAELQKNVAHTLAIIDTTELHFAQLLHEINTGHPRNGIIELKMALLMAQAESLVQTKLAIDSRNQVYLDFMKTIETLEAPQLQTLVTELGPINPVTAKILSEIIDALLKKRDLLKSQHEDATRPHTPGMKRH